MSAKSGLDIVGIPTLFQSMADERKTGTLKVQSELGEKYVYFKSGNILQVSSPKNPSILAEGLRRHPDLDEESYQALCKQQKKTGQSLASLLLADEEDGKALVTAICQFQILEEICELFSWKDCHSEFIEGEPDSMLFDIEIMDIDAMDVGVLLLESARRTDEWKVILESLPSKKDIPYRAGNSIPKESGNEVEAVWAQVDGFKSVEDILAVVRLSPFAAMSGLSELVKSKSIQLKNAGELLQLAKLDVFREDITRRTNLYERALELGAKNQEITTWLAHSYESMGVKDKAARQYYELGYHHLNTGKYEEAAYAFSKVTQLVPDHFEAQERLVTLLARIGEMKEFSLKTNIYARWLAVQGQQERAILLLKEVSEKYPENLDNIDLLGSLYHESGYKAEAINIYKIEAGLREGKNEYDRAAKVYQKIVQIDQENLESRKSLAGALKKIGREKEAMDQYRTIGKMVCARGILEEESAKYLAAAGESIVESEPNDLLARKWMADAYLSQSREKDAISQLHEILKRMDEKKNLELLVETLKTLVVLEPKDLDNHFKLAETYLKIKKEREAVQEYFVLGLKAAEIGETERALSAFDRLLSFDPSNYATHLKKADILLKENKKEEAIEELMLTGYLSKGADKLWQAVKSFRQALSIDKNTHALCYLELGKLYQKLGKEKEALAAYKKHAQKNVKISNFGAAIESCENILKIDSKHEWARGARQKIVELLPEISKLLQQ